MNQNGRFGNYRLAPVAKVLGVFCFSLCVTGLVGVARADGTNRKATEVKVQRARLVRASWYGASFHGKTAANGRPYDARRLTAAHRSWRLGSKVRVRNPKNGQSVVVEITDRGPFVHGREIDLSYAAAQRLGIVRSGVAHVEVQLLPDDPPVNASAEQPVIVASVASRVGLAWPRAILR